MIRVGEYFEECEVYRIDHYLGKETVLNLLALRFANSLFVNNWDNRTIDHVGDYRGRRSGGSKGAGAILIKPVRCVT